MFSGPLEERLDRAITVPFSVQIIPGVKTAYLASNQSLTPTSRKFPRTAVIDGLQLQRRVITSLGEGVSLRTSGLISDVPESFSTASYRTKLSEISDELATLPRGPGPSSKIFEDIIGMVIKLCFFRALSNVVPKPRDVAGTVVRDWIASNRDTVGFWAIVRDKYSATQIIWECKNYNQLKAEDFQQCTNYMNEQGGRFCIMVCRAESPLPQHIFDHVSRAFHQTKGGGLIIVLRESDIRTFLRQALNGKQSEQHLQDIFDTTERKIS